jgi:hypothetical protein
VAIHWVTTAPNPRSPATGHDAGQRGWRLHAVEAPADAKFIDIKFASAACGLRPRHGWDLDMFIEDRCIRCSRALTS